MRMIRFSVYITGIIIALAGNLAGQARLRIVHDRFDMGSIPGGSVVSHYFWFKSVGADTVFIDSMSTNCGCALDPLDPNWIAPGDSLRVNFCWQTGKVAGSTGSYPYIFTNDDLESVARVYMTGNILKFPDSLRPLSFKPYILDLSRFRSIANDSIDFKIRNSEARDVKVRLLGSSALECELNFPEIVPAQSTVTGYIKVKPEFIDKEFNRSCTLEIEGERTSRVTLPVRRKLYKE